MQIAGVEEWEKLPGRTIRTKGGGLGTTLSAIGHIVKEDWFDPRQEFNDI